MPYPHKFIKLTDEERKELKSVMTLLANQGKWKKRQRVSAILFSDEGHTYEQISRLLRTTYRSVKKWIPLYRRGRLAALIGKSWVAKNR